MKKSIYEYYIDCDSDLFYSDLLAERGYYSLYFKCEFVLHNPAHREYYVWLKEQDPTYMNFVITKLGFMISFTNEDLAIMSKLQFTELFHEHLT